MSITWNFLFGLIMGTTPCVQGFWPRGVPMGWSRERYALLIGRVGSRDAGLRGVEQEPPRNVFVSRFDTERLHSFIEGYPLLSPESEGKRSTPTPVYIGRLVVKSYIL